jgi:hypothetical protein
MPDVEFEKRIQSIILLMLSKRAMSFHRKAVDRQTFGRHTIG